MKRIYCIFFIYSLPHCGLVFRIQSVFSTPIIFSCHGCIGNGNLQKQNKTNIRFWLVATYCVCFLWWQQQWMTNDYVKYINPSYDLTYFVKSLLKVMSRCKSRTMKICFEKINPQTPSVSPELLKTTLSHVQKKSIYNLEGPFHRRMLFDERAKQTPTHSLCFQWCWGGWCEDQVEQQKPREGRGPPADPPAAAAFSGRI